MADAATQRNVPVEALRRMSARLGHWWYRVTLRVHRASQRPLRVLWLLPVAFAVGYAGWEFAPGDDLGIEDTVYRTFQLFVLQVDVTELSGPLLYGAAFFAPLATAGGVWALAELLFRPEHARIKRNHVVICGLGRIGYGLTKALTKQEQPVVVIEHDPDNDLIQACRDDRALVLVGDARTDEILDRARIDRARRVIVVAGDDGVNAEIGEKVRARLAGRSDAFTTCEVHIVEPALWRLVGRREIREALQGRYSGVDIDYFNVFSRGARILLDEMAAGSAEFLAVAGDAPQHLVVAGTGRFARSLVVRATRRAMRQGRTLAVTMIGPNADVVMEGLQLSYRPWPAELRNLVRVVPCDIPSRAFVDVRYVDGGRPAPTVVCVSLDDDADSLVAALLMERESLAGDAPIYVRMREERGLAHLLPSTSSRIEPCGTVEATCADLMVTGGMFGDLARQLHERYLKERELAGESPDSNDLLVPWEQVSDEWRFHKRFRVQRLLRMMRDRGFECGSTLALDGSPFRFTEGEAAKLAELAHEDYLERMEELELLAGRLRRADRDWTRVRQKLPWEQLEPRIRQRDLARVALLPELLEEEGISVTRSRDRESEGQSLAPDPVARFA